MKLDAIPPVGSRWQLPDYPGTVFEVVAHSHLAFSPWATMRTVVAGPEAKLGSEFEVELAWFEHRKASEVKP